MNQECPDAFAHPTGRNALREYETTFIVQPEISEEGNASLLTKLDGVLETGGAARLMCEDHGKRKLAYEIKKFHKGHYYTLMFLDEGQVVPDLERVLRLDESVLRFLTIQATEEVADVEARKATAAEAEVEQTKRAAERAAREAEEAEARRVAEETAQREAAEAEARRASEEAASAEAGAEAAGESAEAAPAEEPAAVEAPESDSSEGTEDEGEKS
jgi:small subunit ribosomal protein S6